MIIRQATDKDLASVIMMWKAMQAESPIYRHIPSSLKKVIKTTLRYHLDYRKLVLIVEHNSEAVGMLFGRVDTYLFSDECYISEVLLYVKPENRKGFIAYRLIKAFEAWGKDLDITRAKTGVSTGLGTEEQTNFYCRLGYTLTGTTLSKEI